MSVSRVVWNTNEETQGQKIGYFKIFVFIFLYDFSDFIHHKYSTLFQFLSLYRRPDQLIHVNRCLVRNGDFPSVFDNPVLKCQ